MQVFFAVYFNRKLSAFNKTVREDMRVSAFSAIMTALIFSASFFKEPLKKTMSVAACSYLGFLS